VIFLLVEVPRHLEGTWGDRDSQILKASAPTAVLKSFLLCFVLMPGYMSGRKVSGRTRHPPFAHPSSTLGSIASRCAY
jgi:hypothetical protein